MKVVLPTSGRGLPKVSVCSRLRMCELAKALYDLIEALKYFVNNSPQDFQCNLIRSLPSAKVHNSSLFKAFLRTGRWFKDSELTLVAASPAIEQP